MAKSCNDCTHVLRFKGTLACGNIYKPSAVNPETGAEQWTVDEFGGLPWRVDCKSERTDRYKFWGGALSTDNCGMIGRNFKPKEGL